MIPGIIHISMLNFSENLCLQHYCAAQESSQETIIGDDYIKRFPEYEQFVVAVLEKIPKT
jgi:hypothetical protein